MLHSTKLWLKGKKQLYWGLEGMLLIPPVVFWLGVAQWILFRSDSLLLLLVGKPQTAFEPVRSIFVTMICPILAIVLSVIHLKEKKEEDEIGRVLSQAIIVGCILSMTVVVGYLFLENFKR